MNINYNIKSFLEADNTISYKYEENSKHMYFEIGLYTDKFKEYQKNLFNEFYSSIIDIFEKSEIFIDFKRELESKIKQFNVQLKVFQEKTNLDEKIEIRGNLQIIWDNYYLSTLIGESSIIIFRNQKLEIVVPNEVEEDDKIDIFSEIIEGELENEDQIISLGCNIYNYLTDNEIKELIETDNIQEALEDILSIRVEKQEIGFISYLEVEIEKVVVSSKKEINLEKYKELIQKNKYAIGLIIGLGIIFFVIVSIFLYMGKNKDKAVIQIGNQNVELNLTDIKREIDAFSKLNTDNTTEKQAKYEKIMKELELYEKSGIQQLEIKELKKKMEQNYYKGFNINIITENDGILNTVYTFKENEIEDLENLEGITKTTNSINVYGKKGTIIGIINDKTKGVVQKLNIPANIKSCTNNLTNNGLYCILDNNDIYNFSKYGTNTLTTTSNWPENIISLGTYGVNRLYLLNLDPNLNEKGVYIKRFTHKGKNVFSNPIDYIFNDTELAKNIYTGSSLAVDGTFLIWSKKGLLQAFNDKGNKYNIREVKGWEQGIIDKNNDLKGKVKVIAYPNSNYVSLYDYNTKSLIVYYSRYKNTDNARTSYQLAYLFKIKVMLNDDENIKDITISNSKKPSAYILTNKKIYKVDLSQFRE